VAVVVLVGGHSAPSLGDLAPAAVGGIAGVIALAAFYRGLAIGTMSIVAPIAATGAAVPVLVGLATGDRPGARVMAGIVIAVVGVVLAAREDAPEGTRAAAVARQSVLLALVAALGFGTFFVGLDASADADVWWALLAARVASFSMLCIAVAFVRPELPRSPATLGFIAAIGAGDLAANACFAAATNEGLLSVVSVLASLYPVVTVLLARAVLGERVRPEQGVGIAAALAGVALIASGA
jgi:drug/metabolite transporter (DMT)-like permease